MEQELAQNMHLLHTMQMNPPGPGDWMHADSESNLVSQEHVGYQYHTIMQHKDVSTNGKQHSHSRAMSRTKSPAAPNSTGRADSLTDDDTNLKSPTSRDSPLSLPTAGKRHAQQSKSEEREASQRQFGFRLPGEPLASQELNSALTSPRRRSLDSSTSSMEQLL